MNTVNKALSIFSATSVFLITAASQAAAQITNPAVGPLGNDAQQAREGTTFVMYFLVLWNALISVGAIAVLIFFLWGAFEWITSAGDSSKMQSARNRMLHAFVGLLLLVSAYTIIGFISELLFGENFNILIPTFITPTT